MKNEEAASKLVDEDDRVLVRAFTAWVDGCFFQSSGTGKHATLAKRCRFLDAKGQVLADVRSATLER